MEPMGLKLTSGFFFDKSAADLSLAEAAMLAGVPKGPSYYSPVIDYDRAKARQELILSSMVENGYITQDEADTAKAEELIFVQADRCRHGDNCSLFPRCCHKSVNFHLRCDGG